jgi:hypothetical protein
MPLSDSQKELLFQNQPETVNLLTNVGFQLIIPDLPHVQYFGTDVSLPGCSVPITIQSTPSQNVPRQGIGIQYELLVIKFQVDSKMNNYFEIYNWITSASDFLGATNFKDITLSILSPKSNENVNLMFHHAFPSKISGLKWSSQVPDTQYLTCEVSFAFTYFDKV